MTPAGLYREMAELTEKGVPFVLATVIEAAGSTPRGVGAKMLVLPDGRTVDTVGGGRIELQVIQDALECLKRRTSRTVEYALRPTGENALGMACGGEAKVFLEVHSPAETFLIIGAGHIGQTLAPMAKLLDYHVVVLDSRPEYANAERIPSADELVVGHPGNAGELVTVDERTHVVIVTHGHVHDKDALRSVVATPAAYVGMIGSRTKVRTVFAELEAEGVSREALARVHTPIGLDLGGDTPGEISVAILAEIIAEKHGRRADAERVA
jgi:xanthine dehydrogenase accessory factor